jgi:hypothetical protein
LPENRHFLHCVDEQRSGVITGGLQLIHTTNLDGKEHVRGYNQNITTGLDFKIRLRFFP